MRVLFVVEHYYPYIGGAESLFKSLAESLVANGHEVSVVTTRFKKDLKREETINGVEVNRYSTPNRFMFSFFSIPYIIRKAKNFDLIHCTTYNAALPAFIAAVFSRKKVVVTFHEYWNKLWFKLPFLNAFQKLAFYVFEQLIVRLPYDQIVTVSKYSYDALKHSPARKREISMIYNGLDYTEFKHLQWQGTDEGFKYCFFGRLGASKGLDLVLKSASSFLKRYHDSKLVITLPDRPKKMRKRIESLIAQYGIEHRIEIYTNLKREELFKILRSSSCVVIPSLSEGFCYAAAEAVAMKVPIIHSGKGALTETCGGKQIVMEEYSVEGMNRALEKGYNNEFDVTPEPHYHLSATIEKYENLYKKIAPSKN